MAVQRSPLRVGISASGTGVSQSVLASARLSSIPTFILGMADCHHEFDSLRFDDLAILPAIQSPGYVELLLQTCVAKGIELLFLGHDDELQLVSKSRLRFQDFGVRVVVAPHEIVELSRDKSLLGSGKIFPKNYAVKTFRLGGGHFPEDLKHFPFPAVVKPAGGSASANVQLIKDLDELLENDWGDGMVLQEFIFPKARDLSAVLRENLDKGVLAQKSEVSVQLLFGESGFLGHFVSENDLESGVPVSIRSRSTTEVESFVRTVSDLLSKRGMYGPINFQGRVTKDGFRIFEVNPRYTGITSVRAHLGFNEVDAIMRDYLGLASPGSALRQNFGRNAIRQLSPVAYSPPASESQLGLSRTTSGLDHKKVLVYGGVSYLGLEISASLQRDGHHVAVSTRRPGSKDAISFSESLRSEVEIIDILDFLSGSRSPAEFDTIVMVGFARPTQSELAVFESFQLFVEFISLCSSARVGTVINISSRSVYGKFPAKNEAGDFVAGPESTYAFAKYASELFLHANVGRDPTTNHLSLRIGRLFGPSLFARRDEFPHRLVRASSTGEQVTLSGEDPGFDLVDVRDVGALVSRLVGTDPRSLPQGYADVGGTELYSAAQLVALVQEVIGRPIDVAEVGYVDIAQSGSSSALGCSNSRITPEWFSRRTIKETIDDCFAEWCVE